MSDAKENKTLADHLRDMLEVVGKLLNPPPTPQPIPVRNDDRRPQRRR